MTAGTSGGWLVLDASVSLTWLFEDEACEYGDDLARKLPSLQAVVPDLWYLEVANAICVGERKKRVTQRQSQAFLADLRALPITADRQQASDVWEHTLPLARLYQLTSYDAAYLELAMRRSLPVATIDGPLKRAAEAAGVPVFQPAGSRSVPIA
jgi:predicted nucleic acid-binding protein